MLSELYKTDGHAWYFKNAELLRNGNIKEADLENIAEELESMGKNAEDKLESILTILFLHLLKLKYQSDYKVGIRGWILSVKEHAKRANRHLYENPSLKSKIEQITKDAYSYAVLRAAKETKLPLSTFPEKMPFTLEEACDGEWLQEGETP